MVFDVVDHPSTDRIAAARITGQSEETIICGVCFLTIHEGARMACPGEAFTGLLAELDAMGDS